MGFLDEFKRLAHPYEDEEEDDFEDDFDASPRPIERRERERAPRNEPAYSSPVMDELEARRSNKVVNIRAATQLQVVLVKPERFEEARPIADHLNSKHTVVINLSLIHICGSDAADQLGDAHHVGHFSVDLCIDDVQGDETRLVL